VQLPQQRHLIRRHRILRHINLLEKGGIIRSRTRCCIDLLRPPCISAEEANRHWRETGRDYKPSASCGNEPGNVEPGSHPQEALQSSEPPRKESFAEAQKRLDPHDDPNLILHHEPDGSWSSGIVSGPAVLPDWVRTTDDVREWNALSETD
ncbi:MAG TPA: hypothetical protein VGW38_21655, partial [Chloroflexota bacterium]|nr:hypothetical protein [Chloroflexota bacterium]